MTEHRNCANCNEPYTTRQPGAIYCSRGCKTEAGNLEMRRGKQLYRLAYHWRLGKGASFSDLSWLMDQFIKEDKQEDRPPPPPLPKGHGSISTAYLTNKHMRELGE